MGTSYTPKSKLKNKQKVTGADLFIQDRPSSFIHTIKTTIDTTISAESIIKNIYIRLLSALVKTSSPCIANALKVTIVK